MKIIFVISALVLCCLGAKIDNVKNNPAQILVDLARSTRIVNGQPADDGEYPFMVSLQRNGRHYCGATIISNDCILTAAHCIYSGIIESYTVRVGTNNYSTGAVHQVVWWNWHAEYKPSAYWNNDIAVVKISPSLTFGPKIRPVTLPEPNEELSSGSIATAIGWGSACYGCGGIEWLQEVNVRVYSHAECLGIYGTGPTEDMICAGIPEENKGVCSGDSGGPLLHNGIQYGVTSWTGLPCAQYPAVWTKVSHYISWIRSNCGI